MLPDCQFEGTKRWRLYQSNHDRDVLPRMPSRNFNDDELPRLLMDTVLEPVGRWISRQRNSHTQTEIDKATWMIG